ncbi:MAG: hypothetical protein V8S81_07595 [Oscillospiraceae bacterium]
MNKNENSYLKDMLTLYQPLCNISRNSLSLKGDHDLEDEDQNQQDDGRIAGVGAMRPETTRFMSFYWNTGNNGKGRYDGKDSYALYYPS